MKITLNNIGRRFNRDWIFKGVTYTFKQGNAYAILGRNGSGKSTLLQIIAGNLSQSEGIIATSIGSKVIDSEELYSHLTIAAPYLELIEEFTLKELIDFHFSFKPISKGITKAQVIDLLELSPSKNKALKYFSSGMKQRTKLALAVCTDTPVLLLDEPTSNLDSQAIDWYHKIVSTYTKEKLVIVCSNQEHEYSFCQSQIQLSDYKRV